MITCNFLPSKYKRELKPENINLIIFIVTILIFSILALCVLLLNSAQIITNNIKDTTQGQVQVYQKQLAREDIKKLEEDTSNLNKLLTTLDKIQEKRSLFSRVLFEFSKAVPQNVYLLSFACDKETYQVNISGLARTRYDLLDLSKNLNQAPAFENVASPLSNLAQKENIDFKLSFSINKDYLGAK